MWEEFLRSLRPVEAHSGEVYYSPQANRFFQVRGIHDDYQICSGFVTYFADAEVHRGTQNLSWEFIRKCQKVIIIDQCGFAEIDPITKAWKVKEDGKVNP